MISQVKKTPTICVGLITGAHGVRGLVKVRSFTADPQDIFDYAPLMGEDGSTIFKMSLKSAAKDHFIASIEGVQTKEAADQLRGDKLFVSRDALPKTRKGEFYQADLVGLGVFDEAGKNYGRVLDIHDHGAGVFLEIGTSKKDSFMLPFKDAFVPEVDVKAGKVLIDVPHGWL
jgi:16S rRNA processing protein RimM